MCPNIEIGYVFRVGVLFLVTLSHSKKKSLHKRRK